MAWHYSFGHAVLQFTLKDYNMLVEEVWADYFLDNKKDVCKRDCTVRDHEKQKIGNKSQTFWEKKVDNCIRILHITLKQESKDEYIKRVGKCIKMHEYNTR